MFEQSGNVVLNDLKIYLSYVLIFNWIYFDGEIVLVLVFWNLFDLWVLVFNWMYFDGEIVLVLDVIFKSSNVSKWCSTKSM